MSKPLKIRGFRGESLRPLLAVMEAFPADQYLSIEVKAIRHPTEARKRTDRQNRYLFGVPIKMIRERIISQNIPQEAKDAMTAENTLRIVKIAAGISHLIPLFNAPPVLLEGRSRNLSTVAFMDFITKVQAWASEVLGIYIPDPKEAGYEDWLEEMASRE